MLLYSYIPLVVTDGLPLHVKLICKPSKHRLAVAGGTNYKLLMMYVLLIQLHYSVSMCSPPHATCSGNTKYLFHHRPLQAAVQQLHVCTNLCTLPLGSWRTASVEPTLSVHVAVRQNFFFMYIEHKVWFYELARILTPRRVRQLTVPQQSTVHIACRTGKFSSMAFPLYLRLSQTATILLAKYFYLYWASPLPPLT